MDLLLYVFNYRMNETKARSLAFKLLVTLELQVRYLNTVPSIEGQAS